MAKKSTLQIIDNQQLKESKNSLIREFEFSTQQIWKGYYIVKIYSSYCSDRLH